GEQLLGGGDRVLREANLQRREPAPVGLVAVLVFRNVADVADVAVDLDDVRRHAPRTGKPAEVATDQLTGAHAGELERRLDRLGSGGRGAVEGAADPGAEAKGGARRRRAVAFELRQHARCGIPQALLEEPEQLPDLVDDLRSPRTDLVGLPEDRDLLRESFVDA